MKMWGITNTGLVRSENQDAYAAFTVGGYSVAVVCDGMGGTNGGRLRASFTGGHDYLSSSSTTS